MKKIALLLTLILLTGCSTIDVNQYQRNSPQLDLFQYFTGETKGYGIVQDRRGVLTRYFTVDIMGTIEADGSLKLYEVFNWNDGEESTRTWMIAKDGSQTFSGTAEDVVGTAAGKGAGNSLNWNYTLNLEVDDAVWKIKFDDWMFLVTDQVMINKAKLLKFGLTVGEVTIVFNK